MEQITAKDPRADFLAVYSSTIKRDGAASMLLCKPCAKALEAGGKTVKPAGGRCEKITCAVLSMMYSRLRGFKPSFFSRSKGISLVVAWTLPLTLLHHARACPLRSARLLYLIPIMKLSRTNCTVRSTFPFVCPGTVGTGWA